jgi:hypothetical protein
VERDGQMLHPPQKDLTVVQHDVPAATGGDGVDAPTVASDAWVLEVERFADQFAAPLVDEVAAVKTEVAEEAVAVETEVVEEAASPPPVEPAATVEAVEEAVEAEVVEEPRQR